MESKNVSTKQIKIAKFAKENPKMKVTSLNHYLDLQWMHEAYKLTRKDGACGVDNQTAILYEKHLSENLICLLEKIKSGNYKAPPVKRVYIPKADGSQRELGIPTFEDKIAQRAILMLLDPIYEQDFYSCSFGFRRGKSAHLALRKLRNDIMDNGIRWILDVDIRKFFDSLSHQKLREILSKRIVDGVVIKMIHKWLAAGIFEKGSIKHKEIGTPQGGVISPLLANIFLHEVLDEWFETIVKPLLKDTATLTRFCDDFVMGFKSWNDMKRVHAVLGKRLEKFGLKLHTEKTKIIDFRFKRPEINIYQEHSTSFNFLGFTHVWGKSLKGNSVVYQVTAKDRLSRAILSIYKFCKDNRHASIDVQYTKIKQKMTGHFAYFGITGNSYKLSVYAHQVERIWQKWLSRRSRNSSIIWSQFSKFLSRFPLPSAKIVHQYKTPQQANLI